MLGCRCCDTLTNTIQGLQMNDQEKLRHQIATKIYEKTGIAIDTDDPIIIVTLSIIDIMNDNLIPFNTKLESTTELLESIDKNTENYINITKQYLLKLGQKEITTIFDKEIKKNNQEFKKIFLEKFKQSKYLSVLMIIMIIIQILQMGFIIKIMLN